MSRTYAFEDPDLETFRKKMIREVSGARWLKGVCEKTLGRECETVALVGSVLDPRSFHDSSDVDVAFSLVPQPGEKEGLSEDLSHQLQQELIKTPIMLSVVNSLVFIGPIKTNRGKSLHIANSPNLFSERSFRTTKVEVCLRQLIRESFIDISYRGEHTAPDSRDAPLYDLTMNGVYPADVYTHQRYYTQEPSESVSWAVVNLHKGKPNARVKIYRAVPTVMTPQEELNLIKDRKKYILRHGRLPPGVNTSKSRWQYYDELCDRERELESTAAPAPVQQTLINPGDWVSIDRAYAVSHGEDNLGGKGRYRIISKTVLAKHLFTDGNSIVEWGYSP